MHRAAIALLILAACASGRSGHRTSTWVNEVLPDGMPHPAVIGPHYLRIHLQNLSHEPILVQSIHVEAAGQDLDSDQDTVPFNQTVEPGQTASFDMYLTVSTRAAAAHSGILSEVTLTIGGKTSEGSDIIIDSGRYFIGRESSRS